MPDVRVSIQGLDNSELATPPKKSENTSTEDRCDNDEHHDDDGDKGHVDVDKGSHDRVYQLIKVLMMVMIMAMDDDDNDCCDDRDDGDDETGDELHSEGDANNTMM